MEFTNTRFKITCRFAEMTQAQYEAFSQDMQGSMADPVPVFNRKAVVAAIKSGILVEPKLAEDEVAASNPGLIRWLSDCIARVIDEAVSIDPLP